MTVLRVPGWVLALIAVLPLSLASQQPAAAPRPSLTADASVEGIREYALPNGLQVLLLPDPSQSTVTINITYLVGSRFENYGEKGMAHLLEHMLFKGSRSHPDIPAEETQHGAEENGTTSDDRTNYYETVLASPANLAWALDLEADRMMHSNISTKDLATEFTVVRNEFERGENSPQIVLQQRVVATAFLWHNYGNSTIGARSDIEHVSIERLQQFYHKYYQPDNAVLVVAGRFDDAATRRLIREKLGTIPRPDRTGALRLWPDVTVEPTQDGERSVTLRRVGDEQRLIAAYHVPASSDPEFPAVDVLAQVLGAPASGRLYSALVTTGMAASVDESTWQAMKPSVLLLSAVVPKEDSLALAEAALRQTLDRVLTTPPSAEEVERAKSAILKRWNLTFESSRKTAIDLTEWIGRGDWRLMFLYRDRVRLVTPEDVKRVASAYLVHSNLTLGRFIPETAPVRAVIPPTLDVQAMVRNYKGDTTFAVGEAFDPSPDNVDKRTTTRTLPGGARLALLPKQTRRQMVNVEITLQFGNVDALRGKHAVATLAGGMLLRGTTTRSRQQITDAFDQLNAQVTVIGDDTSATVRVQTGRRNLAATLHLLGDVLRHPAFDAPEFEQLERAALAREEALRSDPEPQANIVFWHLLLPYPADDPRATPTIDEQTTALRAVTREQAQNFYRDFYGADHSQAAVVGDFDPAEVTSALDSILGNWKSVTRYERVAWPFIRNDSTTIVLNTPDKANAQFQAGLNIKLNDSDPKYAALTLVDLILGGGDLKSRLASRIRQQDGLSYSIYSASGGSTLDSSGFWVVRASSAPENSAKVEAAFREEMARVETDGFTPSELERARSGLLQNLTASRARDAELTSQLTYNLYVNRTMAFDAALEAQMRQLTVSDLNAALRKFIDMGHVAVVRVGDFKKTAPTPHPE